MKVRLIDRGERAVEKVGGVVGRVGRLDMAFIAPVRILRMPRPTVIAGGWANDRYFSRSSISRRTEA